MSEIETKRPVLKHHAFGIPNPKLPPKNTSASVEGDQRCSSPGCLDYASSACNFCKLHCQRFHKGRHYRNKISTFRIGNKVVEPKIQDPLWRMKYGL